MLHAHRTSVSPTAAAPQRRRRWTAAVGDEPIERPASAAAVPEMVDGVVLSAEVSRRMREADASLLRSIQEAHAALRTADTVTAALATQGETLSAIEECAARDRDGWRQGRRDMRRTRHWYWALAHWCGCGCSDVAAQVATVPTRRLPREAPRCTTTARVAGAADGVPVATALLLSANATAGVCAERVEDTESDGRVDEDRPVLCPLSGIAAHDTRGADALLHARIAPRLDELHGVVGELHDRAAGWNTLLASDLDRLDTLLSQTDKTTSRNRTLDLR
ncbi:hypothetical protein NESM_000419800 [Novymonas esmeraldas]|uniref:Uncharacterized protein n=1 Tax=Novymonas esmeraldas TaxID=1808958 RepID=A0AAW0EQ86_9TRYP